MYKELKFLKILSSYSILFYVFHLITWGIWAKLITSNVRIFVIQFALFILFIVLFSLKAKMPILIYLIPLTLGVMLYLITVISFTERSLTVEMLILLDSYNNMSFSDYVSEIEFDSYLTKRLDEQVNAEYIKTTNQGYQLTPRGKIAAKVYNFFNKFYN
ncbi:MAG: hypothetical protein CL493_04270 [Actinobacteria bacterium]|nr:hypothetical protein [Actinomycetota bacterium]